MGEQRDKVDSLSFWSVRETALMVLISQLDDVLDELERAQVMAEDEVGADYNRTFWHAHSNLSGVRETLVNHGSRIWKWETDGERWSQES